MAIQNITALVNATMAKAAMNSSSPKTGCKISMLWNWTTLNACFLSRDWKITSTAMFAGSCIGIACLVMTLEMLRRLASEYDAFLTRRYTAKLRTRTAPDTARLTTLAGNAADCCSSSPVGGVGDENASEKGPASGTVGLVTFTPSWWEQGLRALLHVCQFGVAYIIMLLAMYFNGYVIISIFLGAFLGSFIFGWAPMSLSRRSEITVCCG